MKKRIAKLARTTNESSIEIELNIDGTGKYSVETGNGMFDHMLAQLSRHGLMDLVVKSKGDIQVGWHHVIEDTGIVLGRAISEAVGDAKGIVRMGHSIIPLDEALAMVAIDFGGRGYASIETDLTETDMGELSPQLVQHFLETLAREGRFNLHVRILAGYSNHHKVEAVFKGIARSMRSALSIEPRIANETPSTKGVID